MVGEGAQAVAYGDFVDVGLVDADEPCRWEVEWFETGSVVIDSGVLQSLRGDHTAELPLTAQAPGEDGGRHSSSDNQVATVLAKVVEAREDGEEVGLRIGRVEGLGIVDNLKHRGWKVTEVLR